MPNLESKFEAQMHFEKNTILNCFLPAQDTAEPISSENRVQLWQEQHFLSRRRVQELKVLKLIFFILNKVYLLIFMKHKYLL